MSDSVLNDFFIRSFLGLTSEVKPEDFLEKLFQSYRDGHLCLIHDGQESSLDAFVETSGEMFPTKPIVKEDNRYYIQKNYVLESILVKELKRLTRSKEISFFHEDLFFQKLACSDNLTEEQKSVIEFFYKNSFGVLCGGPGTGKTYTASVLIKILTSCLDLSKKPRYKIILTAPTGKAALHLQSYLQARGELDCFVDFEAMTLHRLLQIRSGSLQIMTKKTVDADLVIVDEASMIDVSILVQLLESIGNDTKLIFMGDPHQLPPVEMGGVFADLADLFGVYLTRCMRTQDPYLQASAQAILTEDFDSLNSSVTIVEQIDESIVDLIIEKLSPVFSSNPMDPKTFLEEAQKFRVLDALRQGPFGLTELNRKILQRLDQMCPKNQYWAIPILVTVNMPHLNLYNGTNGVLVGKKNKSIQLSDAVAYFAETGFQPHINPPPFEVSFVLSIHKSQGSEFDEVWALFPDGSETFGKESLYTAATRAKKKWSIFGSPDILKQLIYKKSKQISGLKYRLK